MPRNEKKKKRNWFLFSYKIFAFEILKKTEKACTCKHFFIHF